MIRRTISIDKMHPYGLLYFGVESATEYKKTTGVFLCAFSQHKCTLLI